MNRPTTVISLKGRLHEYGPSLERAPAGSVYCGRRMTMGGWRLTTETVGLDWANPHSVKECGSAQAAVEAFEAWFLRPARASLRDRLPELRGAILLCWCAGPCHARWLANAADNGLPAAGSALWPRVPDIAADCGDAPVELRGTVPLRLRAGTP